MLIIRRIKKKKEEGAAASAANALEFIEQLPNGFDTIIGDQGIKLSVMGIEVFSFSIQKI